VIPRRLAADAAPLRRRRAQRLETGHRAEIRGPRALLAIDAESDRLHALPEPRRAARADSPRPRAQLRRAGVAGGSARAAPQQPEHRQVDRTPKKVMSEE